MRAWKDQRPIAVMVDNERTALPHFGTADADVVYEDHEQYSERQKLPVLW